MENIYDVVILGGGPAGLSAGLYSARAKMKTLIIEKGVPGGQIFTTSEIENYPGGIEGETGPTLSDRMRKQAEEFGVEIKPDDITEVDFSSDIKSLKGMFGEYKAKAVILATGAFSKKMNSKGEDEHIGQGVSYCATCDGSFFTDLEVFVIGGGDTAVDEAVFLTKFAKKVTIVHRRDRLRAAKALQERAEKNEKIEFLWDSVVEEVKGAGPVDSIIFRNVKTNELTEYKANEKDGMMGVFVLIGYNPNTEIVKDIVNLSDSGHIPTDEKMQTNIEGVYAAGDVRVKPLRQVVTAVSDGAIAAVEAEKYIEAKFE